MEPAGKSSYLLNLDWSIPAALEEVREEVKSQRRCARRLRTAALARLLALPQSYHSQLAIARDKARTLRDNAATFTVIDEYTALEAEADEITRQLRGLRDNDAIDADILADVDEALVAEAPPGAEGLTACGLK